MSALDDARAELERAARRIADPDRWAFQAVMEDGSLLETYRDDYADLARAAGALVAECESERA